MKEEKKNLKQIDEETLSHLDDEQLKQVAGGKRNDPDDEDDESCGSAGCQGSCPVVIVKTK